MPEGDTIFRAARTLHRALAGQMVTRFTTAYAHLSVVDDQTPLRGQTVVRVESRGKHLLMYFSGGHALRTHMRMSGSWHIYRPDETWRLPRHRMRIVIETAPFVAVGFDVPDAEFLTAADEQRSRVLTRLGPDLLDASFDVDAACTRLRDEGERPIGLALLDQRVMAGVGNVFKCEVLFVCGIHPATPVAALTDAQIDALVRTSRRLLQTNVREDIGGHRRLTTERADPGANLWVYSRGGAPCRRCATLIAAARQGEDARITYWCPQCQPQVTP